MTKILSKITIASLLLTSSFAYADLRFIEAKSFTEKDGLPPQIELTFKVACYETFLGVVRNDIRDAKTGKVTIAVGGLVNFLPLPCAGSVDKTFPAGNSYSGVEYEIVPIKK